MTNAQLVATIAASLFLLVSAGLIMAARLFGWHVARGRLVHHRGRHSSRRPSDVEVGVGVPDIELVLSPQTGAPLGASVKVPDAPADLTTAPQPRVLTVGAAPTVGLVAVGAVAPTASLAVGEIVLAPAARGQLLARAWADRDVDQLAAHGEADDESRLAAFVLAGFLGRASRDPRSEHWLYQAFLTGGDPETDTFLSPFRDEVTFPVVLSDWEIDETAPCTREGLGLSVAAAERANGEDDSAYGVLLDLAPSARVAAIRGLVCLDLNWHARAVRAGRGVQDTGAWAAVLHYVVGAALAQQNKFADARTELTSALDAAHDDPSQIGGAHLRVRALFARAGAAAHLDDTASAWEDLSTLISLDPDFPGASDALKAL